MYNVWSIKLNLQIMLSSEKVSGAMAKLMVVVGTPGVMAMFTTASG